MEEKRGKIDHDNPPFSRLFIVCSKGHTEEDLRDAFGAYGTLEDVWVVKDKNTDLNKGICYIKFKRASEAHIAMEKLHGQPIGVESKPLKVQHPLKVSHKVLLSDSKGSSRSAGAQDTKPRSRIFILIPKSLTDESVLRDEFSEFGTVESVQILKDKDTGASKGCAYVKFVKPSSAFLALEECNEKYRAVIAEPKVPRDQRERYGSAGYESDRRGGPLDYHHHSSRTSNQSSSLPPAGYETISYTDLTDPDSEQRLYIVCHTSIHEEQLYRFLYPPHFLLPRGLEHFELKTYRGTSESRGFAYAAYKTLELATYAKRKLDGLEYPPGHRLIVKYAEQKPETKAEPSEPMDYYDTYGSRARQNSGSRVAASIASLVAPAQGCAYTDTSVPDLQPIADQGTPCKAKLFIVCTPSPPSLTALQDVFCRFSSLIDIQLLPGTAYGYISYGMKESADAARMIMNNAAISGATIRLSPCEEQPCDTGSSKRSRNTFES